MGSQAPKNVPPIVDFTEKNLKTGSSCWLSTSKEVVHALEEYGCFIALYDKVSTELHKHVYDSVQELFDLPLETKVQNVSDNPYFGYIGQAPTQPLYESLRFIDATSVEAIEGFTQQVFPSGHEHLSKTIHAYTKLVSELEQMVLKMVFESYGVDKLSESHIESTRYLLRLIKYTVPHKDASKIAAECHTDKTFMTIIHQMNHVNGLEIRTKAGEWVSVNFPPSCCIVMAGDAFLAWSNERVHSAFHRVAIRGNEERYSVGLSSFAKGIIEIPEELVDDEHPRRYNAFDHFGLLDFYVKNADDRCNVKAYCAV